MIPVLLDLHFVKIYTFGVFVAFSLIWALFVLWKHIKLTSYREEDIFDCVFASLIWALAISRFVYVAFHFDSFGFDFLKILLVNGYPGMSLIGFLTGFFAVVSILFVRRSIPIKTGLDYLVTPLFVALSLSKIGSFLGGVDVGTKTTIPVAVTYVGFGGMRHITAFYEAIFFLVGAFISRRFLFAIRRNHLPKGTNFFWFLFLFGTTTALVDKLKQDHLYFGGLSLNLIASTIFILVSIVYFLIISRHKVFEWVLSISSSVKNKKNASQHERNGANSTKSKQKTKKS